MVRAVPLVIRDLLARRKILNECLSPMGNTNGLGLGEMTCCVDGSWSLIE